MEILIISHKMILSATLSMSRKTPLLTNNKKLPFTNQSHPVILINRSGARMNISDKLNLIDRLFPDGRFDTYFSRSLGDRVGIGKIKELWEEHAAEVARGEAPDFFMLYSHTPYCFSRCSYCIYDSSVIANKVDLSAHLYRMSRECAAIAPVVSSLKFDCLLVGGGTPGLQSDRNFDLMLKTLSESFKYKPGCIRSVEMTPATTTEAKTSIMAAHGINRISLGVQSATPEVLEAVNRGYQTMDQIRDAVKNARAAGVEEVSVDLIAGLPGETEQSFLDTIDKVAQCGPDTIVLYMFQEPQTDDYKPGATPLTRQFSWNEIVAMFFSRAASNGYDGRDERYDFSAAYKSNGNSKWLPVNDLQSNIGSSIIGLGALSFTNIFGRGNYFNQGPENSMDRHGKDVYLYQKSDMNIEAGTCVRRHIEFNRKLPRNEFRQYFGGDPVERFSMEFSYLADLELVNIREDNISWRFKNKHDASRHSALFFDDSLLLSFHDREHGEK